MITLFSNWPNLHKGWFLHSRRAVPRRIAQGTKLVINLYHVLRLRAIMLQGAQKQILIRNPIILYKFLGSYLATCFSTKNRLNILLNHYGYMDRYISDQNICLALCNKITLWHQIREQTEYAIVLTAPAHASFEGELVLEYRMDNLMLFRITFTIMPGYMAGLLTEQTIFIGGSQGTANTSRQTRQAAKANNEISPAAMLILAVQALGKTLNITTITGVSTKFHCSDSVNMNPEGYYSTYDLMWEANGGKQHGYFFTFSNTPYEKSLELVPGNHRSRTRKKREFKLDLYAMFYAEWQQIFNKIA